MKISFKNGFGMVIALAVAIVVAVTLVKSKGKFRFVHGSRPMAMSSPPLRSTAWPS
jgi:hypothetical protein